MLKIGEIRELIRLLDETSLSEVRIENETMKLVLKKPEVATSAVYAPIAAPAAPQPAVQVTAPAPTTVPTNAPSVAAEKAPAQVEENVHVITSPMVGTFYRASSPDAPSYVDPGSRVNTKTIVCIVEAMKLMNEIEAEVSGEVVDILAENGQLVEYGQPLFKIKLS